MARIFLERRGLGDEARRLIDMLDRERPSAEMTGEFSPPLDIIETATTIEIIVDLPGIAIDDVQVVFGRGLLVIGGRKLPPGCELASKPGPPEAAFHLAERGFGRFARAVRLTGAFDAGQARATMTAGELRIVVPRIEERRGREIRISIAAQ